MQPITYLKALNAQGADAAAFLNAQLSINVSHLAIGERQLGCWCNAKGQVIATVLAIPVDTNHFVLVMSEALIVSVLQRMRMFVLRSQVDLSVAENTRIAAPVTTPGLNQSTAPLWQQLECIALDAADQADGQADINDRASKIWRAQDINDGICWLGPETTQQFLPQMLAMEHLNALDYKKGCYPGQEVIARAHYLGRVKRQLWRVDLATTKATGIADHTVGAPPNDGTSIQDQQGNTVGKIVTAANQNSETIGLAVLHDNHIDTVLGYETNGIYKGITAQYAIGET